MQRLNGMTALVTGGASGIGKAIAQRLKREGARVVIGDIQADLGRATAAEGGFEFLEQDVTSKVRWRDVMTEIQSRGGLLDILVNNAGITGPLANASPEHTSLDDWKKIFAVNLDGVFLGCKAAVAAMREAGRGSIINVSSIAGLVASPYATAYGASKAAVMQLTKSVAQHCAEQILKIRCNSVHPGIVRTPLWDDEARASAVRRGVPFETLIAEATSLIPLGDFTLPQDVAAAVAFLASDDARHITGSQLVVDGGVLGCDTYRGRHD